ncbi:MAG: hypothetical protein ABIS92_11645, partial [Polyangia bacterium]
PVTPAGGLSFADGVSGAGRYVELRAEMDVLALISNCPQLNNPCNAYNPTPVRLLIWNANVPSALAGGPALPRAHPLAANPASPGAAKPRLPVLGLALRSHENLLHSPSSCSVKAT